MNKLIILLTLVQTILAGEYAMENMDEQKPDLSFGQSYPYPYPYQYFRIAAKRVNFFNPYRLPENSAPAEQTASPTFKRFVNIVTVPLAKSAVSSYSSTIVHNNALDTYKTYTPVLSDINSLGLVPIQNRNVYSSLVNPYSSLVTPYINTIPVASEVEFKNTVPSIPIVQTQVPSYVVPCYPNEIITTDPNVPC